MQQELVFSVAELNRLEVRCRRCSTRIVVDITSENVGELWQCPTCNEQLFTQNRAGVTNPITAYRAAFRVMNGAGWAEFLTVRVAATQN
jgi:DNA-directed RNA polymerase subunit RPC12/RpoP